MLLTLYNKLDQVLLLPVRIHSALFYVALSPVDLESSLERSLESST